MIRRMLRALAGRSRSVELSRLEIDQTTYAIGDVHGRADLLDELIDKIRFDATDAAEGSVRTVFLGDYIDRGNQSRQVLERLAGLEASAEWEIVFLRGNHEVLLQDFLEDPVQAAPRWFRNGGLETLLSYEIGGALSPEDEAGLIDMRDRLADKMAPVLPFLSRLQPCHRAGNMFFSHAGADPALPLDQQSERALLWGLPSFLETSRTDGAWVVHGHYITETPVLETGRIGVDTGAYYSGRLSAARITSGSVTFLTT